MTRTLCSGPARWRAQCEDVEITGLDAVPSNAFPVRQLNRGFGPFATFLQAVRAPFRAGGMNCDKTVMGVSCPRNSPIPAPADNLNPLPCSYPLTLAGFVICYG
jgi:hypothetical protein